MDMRSALARARGAGAIAVLLATLVAQAPLAAQQAPLPVEPGTTPVQTGAGKDEPSRGFVKSLFVNLGDDLKHVPRRNSVYWLAAGTALALAVHPRDDSINARLVGSSVADTAFKPGKYVGSFPVLLGTSIATYVVGGIGDHPRAKHLGSDLIEATLLSEGITQGIKAIVRRDRPLRSDGTRAPGFSFPSGHASVTFAAATVLQQHLGWKAAVPTYLVASYVAISRLHDNRHFASDVAAGATEGIIIGRSVTWHGRNFYGTPVVGPGTVGMMVSVVR
jgi:membrane-associated phospholipid phosphatase